MKFSHHLLLSTIIVHIQEKNSVLDFKFKTTQPYHVHSISVKESLVCFVLFCFVLFCFVCFIFILGVSF